MKKEEYLKRLSDAVYEYEDEKIVDIAKDYICEGYPALDGITEGLVDGMKRAGDMYEQEEYFVTDLLLCSDAMYAGLDVLNPHLPKESNDRRLKGVIGVVEGDTHDIGKNLVKTMLETAGFEMIDLGRDVKLERFIEAAIETDADMICLSTLMTTTMSGMEKVVRMLEEAGIRDRVKVLIGGGPISQKFCDKIGADGYSANAMEAVKLAKKIVII